MSNCSLAGSASRQFVLRCNTDFHTFGYRSTGRYDPFGVQNSTSYRNFMAGGWCSAQQIKNYMIASGNHTKMSPKDDGLLPVSVTNWPSGLPDKLQLEITKINKNNSHFPIDK